MSGHDLRRADSSAYQNGLHALGAVEGTTDETAAGSGERHHEALALFTVHRHRLAVQQPGARHRAHADYGQSAPAGASETVAMGRGHPPFRTGRRQTPGQPDTPPQESDRARDPSDAGPTLTPVSLVELCVCGTARAHPRMRASTAVKTRLRRRTTKLRAVDSVAHRLDGPIVANAKRTRCLGQAQRGRFEINHLVHLRHAIRAWPPRRPRNWGEELQRSGDRSMR